MSNKIMKSMCCLCIQFTHENTSERTILHQVSKKFGGGGVWGVWPPPPFPGMVDCTAKKASYAPEIHVYKNTPPQFYACSKQGREFLLTNVFFFFCVFILSQYFSSSSIDCL